MLLIDFSPHFTLQVHTAWFNCCEIPRRQASSQFDCIRVPPWGLVKKCPDPFHSHLFDIEDYFGVCLNPLTRWNRTWGGLTPVHMCVLLCSPAVVVVRGAGPTPPAPSPEEQAERAAGKSPHAARPEQHEARSHTQVSGARAPSSSIPLSEVAAVIENWRKNETRCHMPKEFSLFWGKAWKKSGKPGYKNIMCSGLSYPQVSQKFCLHLLRILRERHAFMRKYWTCYPFQELTSQWKTVCSPKIPILSFSIGHFSPHEDLACLFKVADSYFTLLTVLYPCTKTH